MKKIASVILAGAVIVGPVVVASPAQARPVADTPRYEGPCKYGSDGVYDVRTKTVTKKCRTAPHHVLPPTRRPSVWWNPWTWIK